MPAALLFLAACQEPIGGVAGDILPPGDAVEMRFTDSLLINLTTQRIDSEATYRAERQLVGNYVDPLMGRLTATTFTEVLSRSDLNFGAAEDLIYDSLVLRLSFDGAYGNLSEALTLRIFELTDTLPDRSQVSNLTGVAFDADQPLSDPISLQLDEGTGALRIRLDDELGRRLLFADSEVLSDRNQFLTLFKGLALTTDPVNFFQKEPGAIYQLVLASDESQLELYYRQREANASAFQAKIEPFVIGSSTPRFHQLLRTEVDDKLLATAHQEPDTATQWEFIQGVSLVQGLVQFPDLAQLGEVSISRAELVLSVETEFFGGEDRFEPPTELLALRADETGSLIIDDDNNAQSIADATISYNTSTATYNVLLTRYVQSVVSGQEENNGFILQPVAPFYRVNRVVIGGTGHPTLAPRLLLTYSTLPE